MRYRFATQRDNNISDTNSGGEGWTSLIDRSHLNSHLPKRRPIPEMRPLSGA